MPAPVKIDKAEAYRLRKEEKWTLKEIGEHYGVSEEAARQAVKRYEQEINATPTEKYTPNTWPWTVAREHAAGDVQYRGWLAIRKINEGKRVSAYERRLAEKMLSFLQAKNLVVTYHRRLGFVLTNRWPGEEGIFVVRSSEWWAKFGHHAA